MRKVHYARSILVAVLCSATLSACGGGEDGTPAAAQSPAPSNPLQVTTSEGTVAGKSLEDTVAFLGIRYAQPPTGNLRWTPPQPPAAHDGVLTTTSYGAACPQPASGGEANTSEDCLFLNVWKPKTAATGAKLPVLVFIHGGAFTVGSGGLDFHGISQHGLVVVSLNYRLGALGYLANAALRLANKDGTLGNFALMDQVAALTWVQQNISAFGGDPGKVTIWGTSAGATQSFSLLQSPKAKGLFRGAMMQSGAGGAFSNQTADEAMAVGDAAVAAMGCSTAPDQVACLKALPVTTLLAQTGRKWKPTMDSQILTQVPARAFETGNFNQVPVMIGGVYDEYTMFVDPNMAAAAYPASLNAIAPAGFDTTKIQAAYPLTGFSVPAQGLARAMGDATLICGNSARRDSLSAWVPVYGWEMMDPALSFPADPSGFHYGTVHGMDSFYFGDVVDALPSYPYVDKGAGVTASADRRQLAGQMIRYLVNFVKSGNPNGDGTEGLATWPRYVGPTGRSIMQLTLPKVYATTGKFEQVHHCDTLWGPSVFPSIY